MVSLLTEDGLKAAWQRISAYVGCPVYSARIAGAWPSIRLLGRGPFGRVELQHLVEPLGVQAVRWAPDRHGASPILVGDYDWTEEELVKIVLAARGSRLQLTCQQDLVYDLVMLIDPTANLSVLRAERDAVRSEHLALRWVAKHFGWESVVNREVPIDTAAPPKRASNPAAEYPRRSSWVSVPSWTHGAVPLEGVLQASGYKAGWSGLGIEGRRRALRTVIEEQLPPGFQVVYADQWGSPRSAARLLKTAETLAAFARNARNREANMNRAIEHWEADLAWLRIEYADVARAIPWPST